MIHLRFHFLLRRPLAGLLVCSALACGAFAAQAQTIYRIVGADGKVTFSDTPPLATNQAKVATTSTTASGTSANAALPYELRQIVAKFPVTLYTAAQCTPCDAGRALLNGRGIPFTERTIGSPEDSEAYQRLSGDNTLPLLTIGKQRVKGMSSSEWNQYLDAAGYPTSSALPASYRNSPPQTLAPAKKPVEPKAEEKPTDPEEQAPATGPTPSNPAGIQF